MHKLITIRFSHFNEKARWALDRFGVPYEEEGYMPGLHAVGALKIAPRHGFGTNDRVSTPLGTPILLTDDGLCIRDSSRIVRYVSDHYAPPGEGLYPDPEVSTLEAEHSNRFGPHTRRFAYFHAFQVPAMLGTLAERNVSARQARWFTRLYPVIQRFVSARLEVTPEKAARSLEVIREVFAEVSKRIDGRRYLVGDRFTAADLTFAAMAAPALAPSEAEGYGAYLPSLDDVPDAYRAIATELRAMPAGAFALRMFKEERGARRVPLRHAAQAQAQATA